MGFYERWVLPPVLDLVMQQKQFAPFRARIGAAARGRVLDIGIGSGLNLPFYGDSIERRYGIDPSSELLRLAGQRAQSATTPVELLRGSGEALPFADQSLDTVVLTFTLCTIANPGRALAEARRVLRPDGQLFFAEHGRAPDRGVARWQDRLTPIWRRIGGGCHLNREPDRLIRSAGFGIETIETGYIKGPRPMAFVYSGLARPA